MDTAINTLVKLLSQLAAHKARYKIIMPDGGIFESADFTPPEEKKGKKTFIYKRGETRAHYLPYFKGLKDHAFASVRVAHFDGAILKNNITSFLHDAVGTGNYGVVYRKQDGMIDVVVSKVDGLEKYFTGQ